MPNHTSKLGKAVNEIICPVEISNPYGKAVIRHVRDDMGDEHYVVIGPEPPKATFWRKDAAWKCALERIAALQLRPGTAADCDLDKE